VVHCALPLVARRLIVEVQASGSYTQEYIARTAEVAVKGDLCAQHIAPPGNGGVDVGTKKMGVVDVFGHGIQDESAREADL